MTPTVIALPFVAPAPVAPPAPAESAQRPPAPDLRPVAGVARARPRFDNPLPVQVPDGRLEGSSDRGHERSYDRRRAAPARFEPPRPQPGGFLAQAIDQQALDQQALDQQGLDRNESKSQAGAFRMSPDAAARGSEAYRRAGAQPILYSEAPAFYRILA